MGISKGCLAWLGAAALMGPLRVFAADVSAPAGGELQEITVTAEKRAESQQNVPMSLTTFGPVALQEKAIYDFFDYATKVPNLAFAPTGDGVGTARTISIRGVSGNNVTSYYIDDTPLPDSIDPRILDIDHIEVLRGPQGTLYGARSMGGLVRTVTKEPDLNEFSATLHGGYSDTARTGTGNYTGDGVFNIPLIQDKLALRLSGFGDYEAGYFKRSLLHRSRRGDEPHLLAARRPWPHHGRQCRRDRHLGVRREPHLQAHRLAHHHAALHAAANRVQRLSDGGLPDRTSPTGSAIPCRRRSPVFHPDQDGPERLHAGALVQRSGRRLGRLGIVLAHRALEDQCRRVGLLELIFLAQGGRDGRRERFRVCGRSPRAPAANRSRAASPKRRTTRSSSRKCASSPPCRDRFNSSRGPSIRTPTGVCHSPPIIRRRPCRGSI